MPGNVPVAGSGVGQEDMAELFSALADDNDPLVVRRPGQVVDRARDGLVLGLQDVLRVDGVPDSNFARLVSGGDVEAAGGILGDVDLARVLGVDVGDLRVGQVPDDDAVGVAVEEVLALGILPENYRPASLSSRQSSPARLSKDS